MTELTFALIRLGVRAGRVFLRWALMFAALSLVVDRGWRP
jgi:hypothetical protein